MTSWRGEVNHRAGFLVIWILILRPETLEIHDGGAVRDLRLRDYGMPIDVTVRARPPARKVGSKARANEQKRPLQGCGSR